MVEKSESVSLAEYKKAYRKLKAGQEKIGFYVNFTAFVGVNSLLAAINLMFVPQFAWFIFPLIGWGIGVILHYTFGVRLVDRTLAAEEARVERMAKND